MCPNHREDTRNELRSLDDAGLLDFALRFHKNYRHGPDRRDWFEAMDDARQVCVERGLIQQLDTNIKEDNDKQRARRAALPSATTQTHTTTTQTSRNPMSIFKQKAASNQYGDSEVPPAGNHAAVLVGIIDLGTQREKGFQGAEDRDVHKVMLVWELTGEKKSASTENHVTWTDFNASFNEKAKLRQWIEKWRGKAFSEDEEFDLSSLLGKKCLLTLVHKESQKGRTYAKVDGIAPVPKNFAVPAAQIKPLQWEIGGGKPIPEEPWLPMVYGDKLEDVIKRSSEWLDAAEKAAPGVRPAATATVGAGEDEEAVGGDPPW